MLRMFVLVVVGLVSHLLAGVAIAEDAIRSTRLSAFRSPFESWIESTDDLLNAVQPLLLRNSSPTFTAPIPVTLARGHAPRSFSFVSSNAFPKPLFIPSTSSDASVWLDAEENSDSLPILVTAGIESDDEVIEHIPAIEDEPTRLTFQGDLGNAWYRLKDDTAAVLKPGNLLMLATSGVGAIVMHQDLDGRVRRATASHPERWGSATEFFGNVGDVKVQAPILAGAYFWSLHRQNEELHDLTTTLWSATTINAVSTTLLKVGFNTDRPTDAENGGRYGFPSYHTSSSFTIASVLNEYYGWEIGMPAYVVAGLVGWSRIDSRDHDLSDVVFGASLGYVIGTAVARHHLNGDSRVIVLPWTQAENRAVGVQVECRY